MVSIACSDFKQTVLPQDTVQPPMAVDFAFTHVNLVPMNQEQVLRNRTVLVKDERIVAILSDDETLDYQAVTTIDGKDQYVLPGLADMHSHLRMNPQAMFNQYIANGVTTVRNMSLKDGDQDHLALRDKLKNRQMTGPRYLVSGPQLKPENLPDMAAAEKMMRFYVENGFDVVKIHADLPQDIYDLVLTVSKQNNIMVTGHTQHKMPLADTLRMDSVEHVEELLYISMHEPHTEEVDAKIFFRDHAKKLADFEKPEYRLEMAKAFIESDTAIVTTLTIFDAITDWLDDERFSALATREHNKYLPKWIKEQYLSDSQNPYRDPNWPFTLEAIKHNNNLIQTLMAQFQQQGVQLILGVDAFGTVIPGFSVHKELGIMVKAGLSPFQALETGTINVARYLGEDDERGSIEQGKLADFFMVRNNPLENIENAQQVTGVFVKDQWHNQADLTAMLAKAAALNAR
ncbi:hypothetical protein XM47_00445 [Catenovulum maritimum]|uniref:Amidohydrolase-related domain-containing protein n=1 Tax=Catenovulum maritimum TaxID=1513271 RepID=A0A0J8H1T5_9ALTE|nr:hypothetical protein XM47_00445 [Catenovulum maritimum]